MTPTVTRNDVGFAVLRVKEATEVIKTLAPDHLGAVERDRVATAVLQLFHMDELDCCREQLAVLQKASIDARETFVVRGGTPNATAQLVERMTKEALAILDEHLRQQAALAAQPGIDDGGDR